MTFSAPPDAPLTGEENISRLHALSVATLSSQRMRIGFHRARRTESISKVRSSCTTAQSSTAPTLLRCGIYSVAMVGGLPAGDLTLIASTANDTTLFASAGVEVEKALSAAYTKRAGVWYAEVWLCVTAGTAPAIAAGAVNATSAAGGNQRPRLTGSLTGQSDLPATITAASLGTETNFPYILLEP